MVSIDFTVNSYVYIYVRKNQCNSKIVAQCTNMHIICMNNNCIQLYGEYEISTTMIVCRLSGSRYFFHAEKRKRNLRRKKADFQIEFASQKKHSYIFFLTRCIYILLIFLIRVSFFYFSIAVCSISARQIQCVPIITGVTASTEYGTT